jgi:hypothetical protein
MNNKNGDKELKIYKRNGFFELNNLPNNIIPELKNLPDTLEELIISEDNIICKLNDLPGTLGILKINEKLKIYFENIIKKRRSKILNNYFRNNIYFYPYKGLIHLSNIFQT